MKRCVPFADSHFHFDSNYRFELTQSPAPILTITHTKVIPRGFFSTGLGQTNFYASVSAVVGRNGSGKTSIVLVLKKLFRGEGLGGDYLAVFQIGNGLVIRYKFENPTTDDKLSRLQVVQIGHKMPCQKLGPGMGKKVKDTFKDANPALLYLSPIFTTERTVGGDGRSVFDFSTTAYIRDYNSEGGIDVVRRYNVEEKLRVFRIARTLHMRMRREGQFTSMKLLKSSGLLLSWDVKLLQGIIEELTAQGVSDASGILSGFRELSAYLQESSRIGDYGLKMFFATAVIYVRDMFLNVLQTGMMLSPDWDDVHPAVFDLIVRLVREINCERTFRGKRTKLEGLTDARFESVGSPTFSSAAHKRLCAMQRLIRAADKLSKRKGAHVEQTGVWISLGDQYRHFMTSLDLVRDVSLVCRDCDAINIDIAPRLASGEMAFLSLWARLYEFVSKYMGTKGGKRRDCIVFLDEVETTLHPDWQRKLVWNILRFFELIAPTIRPHIIFSSHSPMILSDIPLGNVVFLERAKELSNKGEPMSKEVGVITDRFRNTFAANIYDLYRLSFFMREGLIGEFAKTKVNEVLIRFRDGVKQDPARSLVGDPFLRSYLKVDK